MALQQSVIDDILDDILGEFDKAYLTTTTYANLDTFLGVDITVTPPVLAANPTNIALTWSASSSSVSNTTNTPTSGNAINFSVKPLSQANGIAFVNSVDIITGVMALSSSVIAGSNGTGAFIGKITIDMAEVV